MSEFAPNTQTTNPQSEVPMLDELHPRNGELGAVSPDILYRGVNSLSIAYHGVRAALTTRRMVGNSEALTQAQRDEVFFDALHSEADMVRTEITDRRTVDPNLPPPPTEKRALSKQAESHRIMRHIRGSGSLRTPVPPGPNSPIALRPLDFGGMAARDKGERRVQAELAKRLLKVRDLRKTQERDLKMFGDTGLHSILRTWASRFDGWHRDKREYKSGAIDAYELMDRKAARKGEHETHTHPVLRKRRNAARNLSENTADAMSRARDRAIDEQAKRSAKQAELQRKLDERAEMLRIAKSRR